MEIGFWRLAYICIHQNLNFSVANSKKLIIMVFETQWKNERPWRLVWGNKGVVVWRFGGLTHTHRCIILLEKMEDRGDWSWGDWHIYI